MPRWAPSAGPERTYDVAPAVPGSHTVMASCSGTGMQPGSTTVTVQAPPVNPAPVAVAVSDSPSAASVAAGATFSIPATVTGSNLTHRPHLDRGRHRKGGDSVGALTGTGATVTYTAPAAAGTHAVRPPARPTPPRAPPPPSRSRPRWRPNHRSRGGRPSPGTVTINAGAGPASPPR